MIQIKWPDTEKWTLPASHGRNRTICDHDTSKRVPWWRSKAYNNQNVRRAIHNSMYFVLAELYEPKLARKMQHIHVKWPRIHQLILSNPLVIEKDSVTQRICVPWGQIHINPPPMGPWVATNRENTSTSRKFHTFIPGFDTSMVKKKASRWNRQAATTKRWFWVFSCQSYHTCNVVKPTINQFPEYGGWYYPNRSQMAKVCMILNSSDIYISVYIYIYHSI